MFLQIVLIFFSLHLFTLVILKYLPQTPGHPDCGICGWATGPLYLTAACCGAKHHAQCLQVCYALDVVLVQSVDVVDCGAKHLNVVVDVDLQSVDVVYFMLTWR